VKHKVNTLFRSSKRGEWKWGSVGFVFSLGVILFLCYGQSLAASEDSKRDDISGLWEYVCTRSGGNKIFEHLGWQHGGVISISLQRHKSGTFISLTGERRWIKKSQEKGGDIIVDLKEITPWDSIEGAFTGADRFLFTYATHGGQELSGYVSAKITEWQQQEEGNPKEILGAFAYKLPNDFSIWGHIKMRRMKDSNDLEYKK
jgi:hypothetical protein